MKIHFLKDYHILLASQETTVYLAGTVVDCKNDEKAQGLIDRGFAEAVQ